MAIGQNPRFTGDVENDTTAGFIKRLGCRTTALRLVSLDVDHAGFNQVADPADQIA